MRSSIFSLFSAVSLLLANTAGALWVRGSYYASDYLAY